MTADTWTLRQAMNDRLATTATQAEGALADERDALTRAVARGWTVDAGRVSAVARAEEYLRLTATVAQAAKAEGTDLVAATVKVAAAERRQLLNASWSSGSSDQLTAALDAVRRDAVARWLRSGDVEVAGALVAEQV